MACWMTGILGTLPSCHTHVVYWSVVCKPRRSGVESIGGDRVAEGQGRATDAKCRSYTMAACLLHGEAFIGAEIYCRP